jgi:hypothetical protein
MSEGRGARQRRHRVAKFIRREPGDLPRIPDLPVPEEIRSVKPEEETARRFTDQEFPVALMPRSADRPPCVYDIVSRGRIPGVIFRGDGVHLRYQAMDPAREPAFVDANPVVTK